MDVNAACVAVAPTDAVENLSERDIIRATAEVVSAAALADGRPEDRDLLARSGAGGGVAALLPVHDLVLRRDMNLESGLLRDELAVADHLAAAPLDIDAPRKCSLKIDVAVTRVAAAECAGADAGDCSIVGAAQPSGVHPAGVHWQLEPTAVDPPNALAPPLPPGSTHRPKRQVSEPWNPVAPLVEPSALWTPLAVPSHDGLQRSSVNPLRIGLLSGKPHDWTWLEEKMPSSWHVLVCSPSSSMSSWFPRAVKS